MARLPVYTPGSNPQIDRPLMVNAQYVAIGLRDGYMWTREDGIIFGNPLKAKPDQENWVASRTLKFEAPSARIVSQSEWKGSCEICGFSRIVERCHIVPARFGGPAIPANILELCPTHHRLFDRNALLKDEIVAVWPRISAALKSRPDVMLNEWRDAMCNTYGLEVA